MAALEHITPEQIAQYGVIAAPDRLTGRADDNKKIFDRLVRELVAVVVNEIIDKTNELLVDESVREENEKERVAAELLRVEAEKLRVQAESQRVTNEDERVQAEAARVAAEALSVQAENLRASAEQSRVDAEQERERAEAERESTTRGIVTQATEQANLAAQSANRASDYEQRSSESARYAADSESQARSYADSARLSSISAGNSETKAKESEDSAKDSAALATDALGKGPYVDQSTKTWFVWDTRVGKFVDTGIKAEGKDGSTISATGLWGVEVDENGDLILTYTGDDAPPLSINEDGDLVYTLDGSEVNLGHVVGRDSQTPSITIGQVETLPAGSSVTASITGQTPNLVLNLGIPKGQQGDTGAGVPPADDVPTDYLLSVGGWVPPQSGGSPGAGDMELVASATLEEAVDVISLELSKPCTEVIAVLTPYGDSSNASGNAVPYLYLTGKTAGDTNGGISFVGINLKNDGAMVYDFRAAYWRLEGNLIYKASYKETATQPTGIMATSSRPWEIQGNNWEITTIDAFRNLRLQLWGAVLGVRTKLEVYGR